MPSDIQGPHPPRLRPSSHSLTQVSAEAGGDSGWNPRPLDSLKACKRLSDPW